MELIVDYLEYQDELEDLALEISCTMLNDTISELENDRLVRGLGYRATKFLGRLTEYVITKTLIYSALIDQHIYTADWIMAIHEYVMDEVSNYIEDNEHDLHECFILKSECDDRDFFTTVVNNLLETLEELDLANDDVYVELMEYINYPIEKVLERRTSFDDTVAVNIQEGYVRITTYPETGINILGCRDE